MFVYPKKGLLILQQWLMFMLNVDKTPNINKRSFYFLLIDDTFGFSASFYTIKCKKEKRKKNKEMKMKDIHCLQEDNV